MVELVKQLDRAAADLSVPRKSGDLPTSPLPRTTYSPPPTQDSETDGGSRSMLFAIGIILGCVFCGAILLMLAGGAETKQPVAPAASTQPANTNRTASDNSAVAQREASATNRKQPVSQRRTRSGRGGKSDGSRLGSAYVVTEPGKTPKMIEPQ